MRLRKLPDPADHLFGTGASEQRSEKQRLPIPDKMRMGIDKPGIHGLASRIYHPGSRISIHDILILTDGQYPSILHDKSLRRGKSAVYSVHKTVVYDKVGGLTRTTGR